MFAFILGLVCGVGMPMQTSINTKLGQKLKSTYLSSATTFLVASVGATIIMLLTTGGIDIPFARLAGEPLWIWTGGICGTFIVILSITSLPKLGSIETMVMLVLGQIAIGLAVDNFGWFHQEVINLTVWRFLGSALVLAGTIIVSVSNKGEAEEHHEKRQGIWFYRCTALAAGVFCGLQIAINGALGNAIGDSMPATLISMVFGFLGVVVVIAILCIFKGGRSAIINDEMPTLKGKWWMFTGGVFSLIIVGGNVVIARVLGTGLSVILNVVGQTFGGIVIDAVGFLGIDKKPVTVPKVAGVLIMIVGIVLVTFL